MYGIFTYIWIIWMVHVGKIYHTLSVWDLYPQRTWHFMTFLECRNRQSEKIPRFERVFVQVFTHKFFKFLHKMKVLGGGFKYFLFSLYLGKIPILTNIFQRGWNHQLEMKVSFKLHSFWAKKFQDQTAIDTPIRQNTWKTVDPETGASKTLDKFGQGELLFTRWFKVPFSSPSWRLLNPLKGSLNHPKKVTLNHQVYSLHVVYQDVTAFSWLRTKKNPSPKARVDWPAGLFWLSYDGGKTWRTGRGRDFLTCVFFLGSASYQPLM